MRLAALRRGAANPAAAEAVSLPDILRICRPHLIPGSGAALPSDIAFSALDAPECSGSDSLTFVGSRTPLRVRSTLQAALIIAEAGTEMPAVQGRKDIPILRVRSLHAAMADLLNALEPRFHRPEPRPSGPGNRIATGAVVEGCLEGDVSVGPGAYVGKGSFVGRGSRIEANAVIQDHCRIGRNCVVQSGAVIGCAGFGFFPAPLSEPEMLASGSAAAGTPIPGLAAMPHPAGVEIGDECWIGANAVVAAGVLNPTVLGRGCKLDSHVQIAHNVRLGEDCLLASQSGIAGSTVAGNRLRMGGASSVDGHLRIGDDVSIAACSGVTKDQPDKAIVAGFPARPIKEWRRQQIALKRIEGRGEG
ncbi:MAG: UDP-3-O-(3-hydroxymyristoyl)-like protein [Fibrobacteres bacterium]|nr:UDP-3-O-(3-hydroxymyristoyl)-like protein [Fibrobacterota bacterium]